MKKLLVISPTKLSAIIDKGEIVESYYNQGGLFDEVYIFLLVNDILQDEQKKQVQKMVGQANLHIFSLSRIGHLATLFNIKFLTRIFTRNLVRTAQKIKPDLIRCYGNQSQAYLGWLIKRKLGIPLIVSVHCTPDFEKRNLLKRTNFFKKVILKIWFFFQVRMEKFINKRADELIAVYKPAQFYLKNHKGKNINLIYNLVNKKIIKKESYELHFPIRLVTVGNQIQGVKDQRNILLALRNLNIKLDIVGQGNLRQQLARIAEEQGLQEKVNFIERMENDEIAKNLHQYDIYVFHTFAPELSKSVIEAMLAGLPIIHNKRNNNYERDVPRNCFLEVEDSPSGYHWGIKKIIEDKVEREKLAKAGYWFAKNHLAPELMEQKIVGLYKKYLNYSYAQKKNIQI